MEDLDGLVKISPRLAEKLASVGVTSYEDLASLGSADVLLGIRSSIDPEACTSRLSAARGVIRGVHWHVIPNEDHQRLKKELDRAMGRMP